MVLTVANADVINAQFAFRGLKNINNCYHQIEFAED
jgi:hypothetical protein